MTCSRLKNLLFIFVSICILGQVSWSKTFRNSYVSFDLPDSWGCNSEGTEWVCFSKFNDKAKEAIIILAAKEAGPTDNMNYYLTYLKQPRTIPNAQGKPVQSEVLHVKETQINDQNWVDSLHLNSEIESYYTRYLATIKNNLAILVTFSAHKAYYTKYSSDFINAIKSLTVVAGKDLVDRTGTPSTSPSTANSIGMPTDVSVGNLDMNEDENKDGENEKASPVSNKAIGLGLLVVAGILLALSRRKKKK